MGEASRSAAPDIGADYAEPACEREGLIMVEYGNLLLHEVRKSFAFHEAHVAVVDLP
jgi:hypothetical protein